MVSRAPKLTAAATTARAGAEPASDIAPSDWGRPVPEGAPALDVEAEAEADVELVCVDEAAEDEAVVDAAAALKASVMNAAF